RELKRGTVPYLEVMRASRRRGGRYRDGGDHLARLEHRLDVRRGAGQAMEVDERHAALPGGRADLDRRIQGNKRDGKIRSVGRNAAIARAEHRVPAVLAADRGAA